MELSRTLLPLVPVLLMVSAGVVMLKVCVFHWAFYLTTAAIMRIGLMEMRNFSMAFFENVKPETFTETSAGVADLITTCKF